MKRRIQKWSWMYGMDSKVEPKKEVSETKDEKEETREERRVQNKPQTLCEKRNETMCVRTDYMAMHRPRLPRRRTETARH